MSYGFLCLYISCWISKICLSDGSHYQLIDTKLDLAIREFEVTWDTRIWVFDPSRHDCGSFR